MAKIIILSLVNWLHLFATAAWIGAVISNIFILMPSGIKTLEFPLMNKLMGTVMKKFRILVYSSIAVLVVTGIVMQFMSDKYVGLTLKDFWILIIVIKHLITLTVIVIGIYILEVLFKKISEIAKKGPTPELAPLQKKQMRLVLTNFVLLVIVLLLTGIASAV